jgi:hypothetical protein
MSGFQLTATWSFASSFHVGTGLSGGGADRTVRSREIIRGDEDEDDSESDDSKADRIRIPEITGEAVKGAIRGSAERIVRWLIHPRPLEEEKDNSIPRHPALRRIFACRLSSEHTLGALPPCQGLEGTAGRPPAAYRFSAPRYLGGGRLCATASTAINPERGVAEESTLRVMQHWSAHAYFAVTIDGRGGEWDDISSRDYLDLVLLVAAFAATAQVGGKKGNGLGETAVGDLYLSPIAKPELDVAILAKLRTSLIAEVEEDA